MMKSSSSSSFRRPFPPDSSRRYNRPLYSNSNSIYGQTPCVPTKSPSSENFIVELLSQRRSVLKISIEGLIKKCNLKPENFTVLRTGPVAAVLYFKRWVDALEAMLGFWESRFGGLHNFTPTLKSKFNLPSDIDELNDRLRRFFSDRVEALIQGEKVQDWHKKYDQVMVEMNRISERLRKQDHPAIQFELCQKKKGLIFEKNAILRRIDEFKSFMNCILDNLEGKELEVSDKKDVNLLKFNGAFNWDQMHCLILRECRRLEDGLPIYSCRKELLRKIHSQQVMVLIGETGSGKSTQVVQFLADSGLSASKSIVCTQPRKIAAISLAHRVREESSGCYDGGSIGYYASFSSAQQFKSKVLYMTDHCLLQHYMNDKTLSSVSCIVIDEAHERSLNTDLLLALLKVLLMQRIDLHLIIMSATADANQLSKYFFGCGVYHVFGRNFPVDIEYVPSLNEGSSGSSVVASYVSDVLRMASEIHKKEKEGTILAFLTSQMEVEWACESFQVPGTVPLPLHGKLSFDEQVRVFSDYPGRRKVIFATNIAETSLTIPGIKYVIDSGWVKESKFEPGSGMNVLKVCRTSQSSANQRAGRAGRTEPGRCYRLYTDSEFQSMSANQEPEIRRVHLGVAILRILALGVTNVEDFDFVDAPSAEAVDMAIRNLVQLGAIKPNSKVYELTDEGCDLVKLGIEPRLGKLILSCFNYRLGKEGVVLAVVMSNASCVFCRVGNIEDKSKSDCQKVQFCHPDGDLFTLLTVYKQYEALPQDRRNKWCWENSINAKTMRRCQDTIIELEHCLKQELNIIIPSYWLWNPQSFTCHDRNLKKSILASLPENVAMFTGYDRLGYEVAMTGKHVQLHPSCSLLIFGEKPQWVVFCEILSITNEYLVCVTAFDYESLSNLSPPPLFSISDMQRHKLERRVLNGFGQTLLKRFCGKGNSNLVSLQSRVRKVYSDDCMGIEVNINKNEVLLFSRSENMDEVYKYVNNVLEHERKWLRNECMEKCLYHGTGGSPPFALLGAGAKIKHLELEKRYLTVDVFHSNVDAIDDKELFMFLEKSVSGTICAIHKFSSVGQDRDDKEMRYRLTFLTPDAAEKASGLNCASFNGSLVKVIPSLVTAGGDNKLFSFPAVKAKVYWPRRLSKGFAIVKCNINDVDLMVNDFFNLLIGGRFIRCEPSRKYNDCVAISGLDKDLSEDEILNVLRTATEREILDFFLVRGDPVESPPVNACEEALLKEISPFMPKCNPHVNCCRVQVFSHEAKDFFMKASITFDGRLHLEAARALEFLEGRVLTTVCLPWQKMKCQQLFHTMLSCPVHIYNVIKNQLNSLLASFRRIDGVECTLLKNDNGPYRVKLSANATKKVAELRKPIEKLVRGKIINHASVTPAVLQHLTSRDGIDLISSLQKEAGVYILFDRQSLNVRVFGTLEKIAAAEQKLIQSLQTLHDSKQLEITLRGKSLPSNLLKEVVKKFGPDLNGLKDQFPGTGFTLNTRRHILSVHGDKDLKPKIEAIINELAQMSSGSAERLDDADGCSICLCDIEDRFELEGCGHHFCRQCLMDQFESAIKNQGSFPVCCANQTCGFPIVLTDMKSLLSCEKLEDLFRASLGAFVASSGGTYRFCPSPDCPSVYKVADPGTSGEPFVCVACYSETCTSCHLEYHPSESCERYRAFKEDPDYSLIEWCKDKQHVKNCPVCGYTIEKVDGCNHIECKCGKHICWVCLEFFDSSDDCYNHLRSIHMAIV